MDNQDLLEPVAEPWVDAYGVANKPQTPESGIALCLSGGGYLAMLFQVGVLWRLNELNLLTKLRQISSVSGASITAAALGANWGLLHRDPLEPDRIDADSFNFVLVKPLRQLAEHTLDDGGFGWGLRLSSMHWISEEITASYRYHLFGNKTLQNLPDQPRFVLAATNVKTGSVWRFSKAFMADCRVGMVREPHVSLALAVAASAAFSHSLHASLMQLNNVAFAPCLACAYDDPHFRADALLTDGSLADPLGIETAWNGCDSILVSDGGRGMVPEPRPATDWAGHSRKLVELFSRQVLDLRKRQVVEAFRSKIRGGALWDLQTPIDVYGLTDALNCPAGCVAELANIPTRLSPLSESVQERLINWGYATCDAAMRRYYLTAAPPPPGFPYPRSGV